MRTFWIVQVGIGAAAIGASAVLGGACGGNVVVDMGTGTSTHGTGTDTATETETYTYTMTDTDTNFPPPQVTCHDCACVFKSGDTPAGCADTCDDTINGTSTPNFCNGAPTLSQCALCIAQRCGVADPTQCD